MVRSALPIGDRKLGHEFSIFEHSRHAFIDLRDKRGIEDIMKSVIVPDGEPFILQPREFVLAITEETLELDDPDPGPSPGYEAVHGIRGFRGRRDRRAQLCGSHDPGCLG